MKNFEHVGRAVKEKNQHAPHSFFIVKISKHFRSFYKFVVLCFFIGSKNIMPEELQAKRRCIVKSFAIRRKKRPHGGDNALPTFHVPKFAFNKVGATVRASSTIACPIMESIES